MEYQKQNTSSNGGQKTPSPSSNPLYRKNPPPISYNLVELIPSVITKKRTDRPMTGHLGPQKQKIRAVSQNLDDTERKMKKAVVKSSDSFIDWSPQAIKNATQAYLTSANKSPTTIDKVPTIPDSNGCSRQNDSGRENDTSVVDKSPVGLNFNSAALIIHLEKQGTLQKQNAQFMGLPLSVPLANVEVNKSCSSTRRIDLEKQQTFEKPNAQYENVKSSFTIENAEANNSLLVAHSHPPGEDVKPSHIISDSKSFKIIIEGIDISSYIPERARASYSNLCGTRKMLLHTGLAVGYNVRHAVFIISETVHIWNAIKNCNITTPEKEIMYWRKSLESFSTMGMDVGFMSARVERLFDLANKAANGVDFKKYEEAKSEGVGLEEKIRVYELEIEKMRERKRKIDDEREGHGKKIEEFEAMFKLETTAPWGIGDVHM